MAEDLSLQDVCEKVGVPAGEQAGEELRLAGITPLSLQGAEVKKTVTLLGLTPKEFNNQFTAVEFDFDALKTTFNEFCKDSNNPLEDSVASKSLEFCAKVLFEYGPYMRTERKSKGDKAIRIKFPYLKETTDTGAKSLSVKVVIITTFKDMQFKENKVNDKLVLTFRQAGLLAMVTFSKAVRYCFSKSATKLLTPLCGAIFSRESVAAMADELHVTEEDCLCTINESATSGGQHLPDSDIACAIVCMISSTKRVTDKNIRDLMISKVVKQYVHKQKQYDQVRFDIFAKYALGGVPPGLDSNTLISRFTDIQTSKPTVRQTAKAIDASKLQTEVLDLAKIRVKTAAGKTLPTAPTDAKHNENYYNYINH